MEQSKFEEERESEPLMLPNPCTLNTEEKNHPPLSCCKVFTEISTTAIPMALSFTFSLAIPIVVLLLQMLHDESDQEKSEIESAAATLVANFTNTVCILAMFPLLGVGLYTSEKIGEWKKLQRNAEAQPDPDALKAKRKEIASINANSLLIAFIVTIPAFTALHFSGPLLEHVFFQDKEVVHSAEEFLQPYSWTVPALMARVSLEQIMFAFGKAKPAMGIGLINLTIAWASFSILDVITGFRFLEQRET